jgi:predicted nucleic acid-binding protein
MSIVFDTNIVIRHDSNNPRLDYDILFSISDKEKIVLPTFIYVETIQPTKDTSKENKRLKALYYIYKTNSLSTLPIIYPTLRTFECYKELQLFRAGKHPKFPLKQHFRINSMDMWIASICYEHKFHIYTCDNHFDQFKDKFFEVTYVSTEEKKHKNPTKTPQK